MSIEQSLLVLIAKSIALAAGCTEISTAQTGEPAAVPP
jgi:hypothetical protein